MGRYAYIIGSNEFLAESGLMNLVGPQKDVEDLSRLLADTERGKFEVRKYVNMNSWEITKELFFSFGSKSSDDLLLVYFSGHGLLDEDGDLYLSAANTDTANIAATGIRASDVLRRMQLSGARQRALVLDCCYSGAIGLHLSKGDVSTASHIQLKNISDGSGTNILTSSTDTQVSKDGPLSMFSKYFIEGIQSGDADRDVDGVITLHDLFTYTSENMRASSTQKPTYFDTGSTAGIVISASGKTSLSEMRKKIREKLKEYWSREDISDSLFSFLMRRFDKESNYSDVTKNRIDALCNSWSTTIWARNPDTGMARWVYQMTPHDEWEYEGVNEMILADQVIGGANRSILVHFDRNGFGYTIDRANGELLVAEKYEPTVNWATKVDMDKNSKTYGRPLVVPKYSTEQNGQDVNSKGICPSSMGAKNQQPAAFSPDTGLFYVPTTQLCMDYEPFRVSYTAGQPYVGATLSMYPPPGKTNTGNFIAWDARTGKIVWSNKEQFAVWSGALATAGGVVFYGTLEGYLKAADAKTGRELFRFKTVSGIVGNVMTYEHGGKQYVAVLSGVGGWPGIGLAAGLTDPTAGLGAVGAFAALRNYTSLGGQLTVFALP